MLANSRCGFFKTMTVPVSSVMYVLRNPALLTGGSSPVLLRAVEIASDFPNKDTDWLTMAVFHNLLKRTAAREKILEKKPQNCPENGAEVKQGPER